MIHPEQSQPRPQPGLLEIAPYVPGRSGAGAPGKPVKLSSNESPLGASPLAIAAYRDAADRLETYPEGSARLLRAAIGEAHGLDPDRIVCGAGSDELLHLLAQAYLGAGDEAVMSRYGFAVYPIVTQAAGARLVTAPERDFVADVDAILAAVTPRTKIVFLANPNNPTGTYLSAGEVARLHRGLRPDILLVIDNAYAEYVTAADYETGVALAQARPNVVMVRTFSKMGLAALRIGWMLAPPPVVDVINRIRPPFNLSLPAQLAGAAAVRDGAFTARLRAHNAEWRAWLSAALGSNLLRVLPSEANFILVQFPEEPGHTAADAFDALLAQGLIVREVMTGYGIPNALRISIGTEAAMRAVARTLAPFGRGEPS